MPEIIPSYVYKVIYFRVEGDINEALASRGLDGRDVINVETLDDEIPYFRVFAYTRKMV